MRKAVSAASTPRDETIQKLSDAFDVAHAKAKSLIDRQDDIVRSLGGIQKLLKLGAVEAAETAIAELLARDLKQSRERTYNQDFALRIAIKTLGVEKDHPADQKDCQKALGEIRALAPEAFEVVGAAPAGAAS